MSSDSPRFGAREFRFAGREKGHAEAHGDVARDEQQACGADGDVELTEQASIGEGGIDLSAIGGVLAAQHERMLCDQLHSEPFRCG